MFIDLLHETLLSGHREPRSIVGGTLYCILVAGYAVVAMSAPWIFLLVADMIPLLLCSANVILLILTGIFQQYWVHQVRKLRLQSYYDFSQKLKCVARLPFASCHHCLWDWFDALNHSLAALLHKYYQSHCC